MGVRKNGRALRFPCECVSMHHGYSDPWASITYDKLLNDGTKERVLNSVARQPKTIALWHGAWIVAAGSSWSSLCLARRSKARR